MNKQKLWIDEKNVSSLSLALCIALWTWLMFYFYGICFFIWHFKTFHSHTCETDICAYIQCIAMHILNWFSFVFVVSEQTIVCVRNILNQKTNQKWNNKKRRREKKKLSSWRRIKCMHERNAFNNIAMHPLRLCVCIQCLCWQNKRKRESFMSKININHFNCN